MAVTRNKPPAGAPVVLPTASGKTRNISKQCTAHRSNGVRCQRPAYAGLTVCGKHGGEFPNAKNKHRIAKMGQGLSKLVTPIEGDDWEADPVNSLEMEFRRTVGRIRYYDEKLSELQNEEDLIWGKTKEEIKDGFEKGDVTEYKLTAYEARVNMLHVLQMDERKHLTDLHKLWIGAKLDERRLAIAEQTVFMLNDAITSIVRGLGKDVNDPEVRQVVRQALIALPGVTETIGA